MSSRPFLKPHSVVTSGDMTGTVTSQVSIINYISGISYDVSWSGTPTGTLSVEVSNTYALDDAGAVTNAGSWSAVTLTGAFNPAGSSGNGMINIAGLEAYAIRLKYVPVSGTGTLNAVICGKAQ